MERPQSERAHHHLVFAGGDGPGMAPLPHDLIIAADSGADLALAMGLVPDVLVGDLDSISRHALAECQAQGTEILRHPTDKDVGDLELALDEAVRRGAQGITVIGGSGGRLGHLLINAGVIAAPRYAAVGMTWLTDGADIHVARPPQPVVIDGVPGDLITLVPAHGDCHGVTVAGARWPLHDATVVAGSSLGLDNELLDTPVTVRLAAGTLLVIHERLT